MAYKYVKYEKEGEIATITFNKPDKMNSYVIISVGDDFKEVLDAITRAEEDDEIKVIIFKGAGRCFSAGQDLSKVGFVYGFGTKKDDPRPSQRIRLKMDKMGISEGYKRFFFCSKLTIAQVHGYALEAGLMIAMLCDFFICSDDCKMGFPGQRIGFAGGGEHTFGHLMMTVGMRRALDLYISGRQIDGIEAERIGLAGKAVPADQLEGRGQEAGQGTLPHAARRYCHRQGLPPPLLRSHGSHGLLHVCLHYPHHVHQREARGRRVQLLPREKGKGRQGCLP